MNVAAWGLKTLALLWYGTESSGAAAARPAAIALGTLRTRSLVMLTRRCTHRAVLLGLLFTAAGLLFWLWPEKPVQAIGANQNDKIVMAAGPMDDGECVFVLDTITAN